jgi:hypothetical protein
VRRQVSTPNNPLFFIAPGGDDIEARRPTDGSPSEMVEVFSDHVYEDRMALNVYTHTYNAHPSWLINVFSAGLIVAVVGLLVLFISAFFKARALDVVGAVLTAGGTLAVALSVLRGQDLEKRT